MQDSELGAPGCVQRHPEARSPEFVRPCFLGFCCIIANGGGALQEDLRTRARLHARARQNEAHAAGDMGKF